MSFENLEYIYGHLPARFRAADKELFLKRFLTFFGNTLDEWDAAFDSFFEKIDPETADARWIEFWLFALFGWSWFPWWFTLEDKQRLYGNFGRHLGRRGTRRGIELWLADFGIIARVHTRNAPYGEFVWGETMFSIPEPLHLIVEVLFLRQSSAEISFWGESAWGEGFYTEPRPMFTDREITDLVRYVQPVSQSITIVWRNRIQTPSTQEYWEQISW
jgi:phage tail-like protein